MDSMNRKRLLAAVSAAVIAATALLAGCSSSEPPAEDESSVQLEEVGDGIQKVTLTAEGAQKVGIATAKVGSAPAAGRLTIPYAAVVYAGDGTTWTYTLAGEHSYVRAPVTIESVAGEVATLSTGPTAGTEVVVVGAPELLGAEAEISGEE
jgi:outer membrane murein-binding lipoprotein Lpp